MLKKTYFKNKKIIKFNFKVALLVLLHLPKEDYELLGITTVYGYVGLRTQVTTKIVSAHEEDIKEKLNIPIVTGSNFVRNKYQEFGVWHAGTEGIGVMTDEEIKKSVSEHNCYHKRKEQQQNDCHDAANFIVEQINKYPGSTLIF